MKIITDIEDFSADCRRYATDSYREDLADFLRQNNFVFADRTIQASISLKANADFKKFRRLEISESELNERICEIAKQSFSQDVRFFITIPPVMNENLLDKYLSEMKKCYVCKVKNEIAGFIEVVDSDEKSECIIRLAAVDEKFRLSGAALSLYAGVCDLYRNNGYRKIIGRISSRNMPVLNLYTALGANFSRPQDVYIRS